MLLKWDKLTLHLRLRPLLHQSLKSLQRWYKDRVDPMVLYGVVLPFLFIGGISTYHALGNPTGSWSSVWVISENMLLLSISKLVVILSYEGYVKKIFKYIFTPYFILKCVYHICCYLQIYIVSRQVWKEIWIIVLILTFIIGGIIILKRER